MSKHKPLEPGVYFGLPEEIYFADPALSRSDCVKLLDTPNSYWKKSFMNPDRPNPMEPKENLGIRKKAYNTKPEMEYGKAFHYLLFQPEEFDKRYNISMVDPFEKDGIPISNDDYQRICESIKVLRKGENSSLFLTGGEAEVTVVFDYNGVRFRTRHDYFGPIASTDFKTTWTLHEGHIMKECRVRGYDIQFFLYQKARAEFKRAFLNGKAHVYGPVNEAMFFKFMKEQLNEFIFIFQRTDDPYPFIPLMPEEDMAQSGENKVWRATQIYLSHLEKYGAKEWPVCDGKVKRFSMQFGIMEDN